MTDRAAEIAQRVAAALAGFLDERCAELAGMTRDLLPAVRAVADFVAGGKRLRPAFVYWGWRGAGGPDGAPIVTAAASLELLHAGALMHDDLMDASDTRRGRPAIHRRFAATHQQAGWDGSATAFGAAAAILLGDLCLLWSAQMLRGCGLPVEAVHRGLAVHDRMSTEVMCGQYLDVVEQARGVDSVAAALRVARYKSAKYTVERPLHLGAALAGGPRELIETYTAYGVPVGEAFQLRDDVLGVYGDPAKTGKPAGDDLREGKRTVLVALAAERADGRQAALLAKHLGDPALPPDGVTALRAVIAETGALAEVEHMIADRVGRGTAALAAGPVQPGPAQALRELAVAATARRV
ncbi:MAG TPA: polyprenyl synthetase family protein [Mycobacteriales bacterium]|nr:polyprenyl synthetase family protein [Mycobacteriales bacterium]